ncbi:MAG TPA: RNA pseudouridine synthase [Clostridia bacterium]|nr:RNA pseudouridine synthase [Clostridia bacterium]
MSDRIEILYEDNHVLVVVKPQNMLTQGDQTGDENLLDILKEDLKVRYNKPGNVWLGLVHRLDRPVGGAMVFAKTSKAASRLSDQIRRREFGKTYLAVVYGDPEPISGTLVHYLDKDEKTNTVHIVKSSDEGKKAVLDYVVKDSREGFSLVAVKLHTGRPHQIRVQLSAIGHPLYGDQKYGASLNKPGMQLALWSAEVGFEHPTLKQYLSFDSQPPHTYPWNLFM